MPERIDRRRATGVRGRRLLAVTAVVSGLVLAGCGGSASAPTVNTVGATSTAGSSAEGVTGSGSTAPGGYGSGPLGFARCMRANGVPNFPDPTAGRGSLFNMAGIDAEAPAFKTAQAKCQKLMGGGPPRPGSTTHPSAQTLGKLLRIAVCMRQHRVPQFPDPRASVPSNPGAVQEITDFDGAILLFPSTMNLQAPAYRQALAACGAPPLGLRH